MGPLQASLEVSVSCSFFSTFLSAAPLSAPCVKSEMNFGYLLNLCVGRPRIKSVPGQAASQSVSRCVSRMAPVGVGVREQIRALSAISAHVVQQARRPATATLTPPHGGSAWSGFSLRSPLSLHELSCNEKHILMEC